MKKDIKHISINVDNCLTFECVMMAVSPFYSILKNRFDLKMIECDQFIWGHFSFLDIKKFSRFGKSSNLNEENCVLNIKFNELDQKEKDLVIFFNTIAVILSINQDNDLEKQVGEFLERMGFTFDRKKISFTEIKKDDISN